MNIYKHIKTKHGQDIIRNVRLYEKLKTKYMKINADTKYIKTPKKEELTPRYAKVNLAQRSETTILKNKITKPVMEIELQNIHIECKNDKERVEIYIS